VTNASCTTTSVTYTDCSDGGGPSATTTINASGNAIVTVTANIGNTNNARLCYMSFITSGTATPSTATVTQKATTSNVATLTATNSFAVGDTIVVSINDVTYNGTFTISARTATTVSYALTHANQATTAATGTITDFGAAATVVAASDTRALQYQDNSAPQNIQMSATFWVTGLTAGSNTFRAQYRVEANTCTYANRNITVIPAP
jgi:hypothetical protein